MFIVYFDTCLVLKQFWSILTHSLELIADFTSSSQIRRRLIHLFFACMPSRDGAVFNRNFLSFQLLSLFIAIYLWCQSLFTVTLWLLTLFLLVYFLCMKIWRLDLNLMLILKAYLFVRFDTLFIFKIWRFLRLFCSILWNYNLFLLIFASYVSLLDDRLFLKLKELYCILKLVRSQL